MQATERARSLRKRSTWAEKRMWAWLRGRRFSGYKFRRQHPVGRYFLDFFCEEARLCIELDGIGHGHPAKQASQAERTRFLEKLGIKQLRFWNRQLRSERQYVREVIFNALQERASHPLPAYTRPGVLSAEQRRN